MIKNKLKDYEYIFFFLFITVSCQKEIEIEIPLVQPQIVVNSLFAPWCYTSPNPFIVYVGKSTSFFDSTKNIPVPDASVIIFNGDSIVKELVYIDSLGYYSSNGGSTSDITDFKAGVNYTLIVKVNDTIIEAEDKIPYKTELQNIQIIPYAGVNENEAIFSKITFNIDDKIDHINYYEIQLIDNSFNDLTYITSDDPVITTEPSYPSNISIGAEPATHLLFKDNTFNGQKKDISIYYIPPNSTMKDSVLAHIIELRLLSISETYYKYRSTQIIQHNNKEVDILYGQAEPINVYCNILGGYGVFAAYNIDSRVVVIKNNGIIDE